MVKKEAILKAGKMDEDFFLYAEEIEWCSRLGKTGKMCIYGGFKVVHLVGEVITRSSGSNDSSYKNIFDRKGLQLLISNHLLIRKTFGAGWLMIHLLNYTFGSILFLCVSFLKTLISFGRSYQDLTKAIQLTRNTIILWSHAPRMILKTPFFYKLI
jgi:GT2 family glycosyltransferase